MPLAARLRFPRHVEEQFRSDFFRQTVVTSRAAALAGFLIWVSYAVLDYWFLPRTHETAWLIRFTAAVPFVVCLILAFFYTTTERAQQTVAFGPIALCGSALALITALSKQDEPGHNVYFAGLLLVVFAGHIFLNLRFAASAVCSLIILAAFELSMIFVGHALDSHDETLDFIANNCFLLTANLIGLASCYRLEYFARRDFLLRRTLEFEQQQSESLLLNILPRQIANVLKTGQEKIVEAFDDASVLFADIVSFTPMSANMAPGELIDFLNAVFSYFDQLADKYGVEKIKTIGDCYMVAAGVPAYRPDHAQVLARMALEVCEYVRETTFLGHRVHFRIGLNSGPLVGGVLGHKKFSYDLWGDTVNTASRMESHGRPARSK